MGRTHILANIALSQNNTTHTHSHTASSRSARADVAHLRASRNDRRIRPNRHSSFFAPPRLVRPISLAALARWHHSHTSLRARPIALRHQVSASGGCRRSPAPCCDAKFVQIDRRGIRPSGRSSSGPFGRCTQSDRSVAAASGPAGVVCVITAKLARLSAVAAHKATAVLALHTKGPLALKLKTKGPLGCMQNGRAAIVLRWALTILLRF